MNMKLCKELMEKTLEMNISNSKVIAEILYEPSFECLGRTVYCQLRRKNEETLICYEHFNRYELCSLTYSRNPADVTNDFFTDNFCGFKIVDCEAGRKFDEIINQINLYGKKEITTSTGIDGFSHTVKINDYSFYWWGEPISTEAKVLDEFVSEIFKFLPENYRIS